MTESTNHSIFMNETNGIEAGPTNPQDFVVNGKHYDDPTNILDLVENANSQKSKKKSKKRASNAKN